MADKTYLDAVKNDYKVMLIELAGVYNKATGFKALAQSALPEVKEAYESEVGKAILRNAERVKSAIEDVTYLMLTEKID